MSAKKQKIKFESHLLIDDTVQNTKVSSVFRD